MLFVADIGFAHTGWSVFHNGYIVNVGVTETTKTKNKMLRVANDNVDRCIHTSHILLTVIKKYDCQGIIGELPTAGSQNASASNKMGIATGMAGALVAYTGLPAEWCTPENVKVAMTGKKNATKDMMMDAVCNYYNWQKIILPSKTNYYVRIDGQDGKTHSTITFTKGRFEHIADSIGVWHALKLNNLVKIYG